MKRAYTIERNELVVDLYKKGKTVLEIAQSINISEANIKKILAEAGIHIPKRLTVFGELITGKLQKGMTNLEIANELGCSLPTVTYYKKALGLPLGNTSAVSAEEIETMKELRYNKGLCDREIAARLDRNIATIRRHIGRQPHAITEFYRTAARAKAHAENIARGKARKYYAEERRKADESARLEAERIERERIEALRLAKENEIKELLASLGIPAENFTIESAETGDAFLNNLITRAAEKLSVGA